MPYKDIKEMMDRSCVFIFNRLRKLRVFGKLSGVLYIVVVASMISIFYLSSPPKSDMAEKLIYIPSGSSIQDAAKILKNNGIIKNESLFKYFTSVRYGDVKAGDYLFKTGEYMWSVSSRLAHGVHGLTPVKITVKEGATRMEIADLLSNNLLRFNKEKFLVLSRDLEGYLFPDTYYFLPNANEQSVIDAMVANLENKLKPLMPDISKSELTLPEIINLASLVEREAYKYTDRRKIAGVLLNRLNINMPLQVDVTWFYTDNKGTPGITLSDLRDKSNPYNTYIHTGLPPSPIGSPSLSAIKAVLYADNNDYLFYLADKYGNTYFSKTYKEHLYKKRKYLR